MLLALSCAPDVSYFVSSHPTARIPTGMRNCTWCIRFFGMPFLNITSIDIVIEKTAYVETNIFACRFSTIHICIGASLLLYITWRSLDTDYAVGLSRGFRQSALLIRIRLRIRFEWIEILRILKLHAAFFMLPKILQYKNFSRLFWERL